MLFVLFLMMLFVIIILLAIYLRVRRTARHLEDVSRRLVPAMVDSMLALTDAQRTIRDILALVPMPDAEFTREDEKLERAITEAIGITRHVDRYAPVLPLHPRSGN